MALKDFFNNYFYGRPGKGDFTERDLPATRMQLFREVLKVRKGSMVGLNLLYLVIWLPAIVWTFMNVVQLPGVLSGDLDWGLESLLFSYLLLLFPLVAITGPFKAGVSYVMRNWARDEHAFPFLDFKQAIKANWKQALLAGIIEGAMPVVAYICVVFYSGMAGGSFVFYLPIAVVLVAALLWSLSAQLIPTLMVTYRLRFPQLVKNAMILTLITLPRAVGVKLATLALPLLGLLAGLLFPAVMSWLGSILLALYAIFMLSFNKLIVASYANAVCEKYLNTKIEGAQVNIGLRQRDE